MSFLRTSGASENPEEGKEEAILRVEILGEGYALKVGEDQSKESLERVVSVMINRLNNLRMKFPLLPEKKLLVLLALNITEELVYTKKTTEVTQSNKEAFVQVLKDIEKLIKLNKPSDA